ncbi:hypothetical protein D3C77_543280 [compost metagenome]
MQADAAVGHRRFFSQRDETLGRLAIGRAHTDVVARHQRLQAGDPGQCDAGLDQPEARAAAQIAIDVLIHLDVGDNDLPPLVVLEAQVAHYADGHTFIEDRGLANLNSFCAVEHDFNMHAALAVGLPGQPGTDRQRDQRQYPDRRPVRGWAGFRLWQISHACFRTRCYPRSDGGRR